MTSSKDANIAKKLSEPLEPSAVRSQKKGNANPVKPEDREYTPTGNTLATDQLQAAYSRKAAAEAEIERIEKTSEKQKDDPLYQRDQKIFQMTRAGIGLPPTDPTDKLSEGIPSTAQHVIMHQADSDKEKEVDPDKQAEEDLKKLEEYEKSVADGKKLTAEQEKDRLTRKARADARGKGKK